MQIYTFLDILPYAWVKLLDILPCRQVKLSDNFTDRKPRDSVQWYGNSLYGTRDCPIFGQSLCVVVRFRKSRNERTFNYFFTIRRSVYTLPFTVFIFS